METNPKVIMLAGPNGAGKSTAAPRLLHETLGITEFVNADVIARGLSGFAPERAAIRAGRIMLERLDELVQQRVTFALETTLSGRAFAPWLEGLIAGGYEFQLFYLWLRSPELAIERVARRVSHGGHSIPPDVIRRRYYAGLRNLFELYLPLANHWLIGDNSVDGEFVHIASGQTRAADVIHDTIRWKAINDLAQSKH